MHALPLLLLLLPLQGRGRQGLNSSGDLIGSWKEGGRGSRLDRGREGRGFTDLFASVIGVRTDSSLIR